MKRRLPIASARPWRRSCGSRSPLGLDVVNDGETGKLSYSTYVRDRLTGFADAADARGPSPRPLRFPRLSRPAEQRGRVAARTSRRLRRSGRVPGSSALERDLANLKAAVADNPPAGVFLSAASPGVIALFHPNRHYGSHEEYIWALAEAMREEYEAIHRAGFLLQLDCPDLAAGYHMNPGGAKQEEFLRAAEIHVAALNRALDGIDPERMRLHLCWGNVRPVTECRIAATGG